MSFENDIMISYAWRDNQPPPLSDSEGWVSDFHAVLEFYLKQHLRRQPTVWRDKNQMPGNKVFADELDKVVSKAAVLITVVSEPYLGSEWCALELANFIKHAQNQGGVSINNDYRIFKINKLPVDRNIIPESLKPIVGFDFFEIDPETRFLEPIDPSLGEEEKVRFRKKVSNIAEAMARLLKLIDQKGISPNPGPGPGPGPGPDPNPTPITDPDPEPEGITVYLPYTSKDLREVRDDLVSELTRRGCKVLPEQQTGWLDMESFNKSFAEDIATASISIHLVGASYGNIIDGETISVYEYQNLYAAEESRKRGLRRLIWIPKENADVKEQQAQYIARLRSDRKALEGADLLEETVENLKSSVLDMIKPKAKPTPPPPPTDGDASEADGPQLYLLYDVTDKDAVREIRRALKDKAVGGKPLQVLVPVFEGEPAELREVNRQKLRDCDAVLVFWGASNAAWLDSNLSEIRKAPGFGRTKKYGSKHLVMLSGAKTGAKGDLVADAQDGFLEKDMQLIEAWDALPLDLLDTYLQSIT